MKKVLAVAMMLLMSAGIAAAAEDTSWLKIGGDYQFRFDSLKGTVHEYVQNTGTLPGTPIPGHDVSNDSLMTNRFGLNLKANALEDVSVKARFIMYKIFGQETSAAADGSYAGDRAMGSNDGTIGHIPQDNTLRVDYGYATWSNIGQLPVWFSVGRRPSTGGIPSNIRNNSEKMGTAGIPSIMVDYAFDGMTLGYAPDIDKLPGAYVKLCYGRGFESGFNDKYSTTGTTLKDTDFMGINAAIIDTDALHAELQYQKGWHIFDMPSDGVASFGTTRPTQNLGDLDWIGGVVMGKVKSINWFFSAARSHTSPNDNTFMNNGQTGLLWTGTKESHSGNAIYLGGRYDIDSTGTKIGAEYNQGSKYWIGMVPAADDVWTSKLGTRGSVYEIYIIQELKNKPISKDGKAFFKLGYQYYKFDYTGSNFWVGAPVKISDLSQDVSNPNNYQMLAPLQKATDIYLTFEVRF